MAAFALAAGGIGAALLIPDAALVPSNIISAGHLRVEINQGEASAISLDNMVPGEHRVAYQYVIGDLAGIATADLTMSLHRSTGGSAEVFAQNASMTVSIGGPEQLVDIDWTTGECTPTSAFGAPIDFAPLSAMPTSAAAATKIPIGTLTGPHAPGFTAGRLGVCVRFDVTLDASAGNEVQAAQGGFTVGYSLTQTSAVAP